MNVVFHWRCSALDFSGARPNQFGANSIAESIFASLCQFTCTIRRSLWFGVSEKKKNEQKEHQTTIRTQSLANEAETECVSHWALQIRIQYSTTCTSKHEREAHNFVIKSRYTQYTFGTHIFICILNRAFVTGPNNRNLIRRTHIFIPFISFIWFDIVSTTNENVVRMQKKK